MSAKTLLLKVIENVYQNGDVDLMWAKEYSEPGYSAPEHGILFANWNPTKFDKLRSSQTFYSRLARLINKTGLDIATEWSDEWETCCHCGNAVRTNADSYSWTRSYVLFNDCEIVCRNCVTADALEIHLMNNANRADSMGIDWSERGWTRYNGTYESGWHPGQDDNPSELCKLVGNDNFLFQINSVGQFDMRFIMWVRPWDYVAD